MIIIVVDMVAVTAGFAGFAVTAGFAGFAQSDVIDVFVA
jgi:hypothetical protein